MSEKRANTSFLMAWFSMLPSLILFLFLSPSFSSSTFSSSSIDITNPSPLCHPYERSALLQFKNSFSVNTSLYKEYCSGTHFPITQTVYWAKNGTAEADCCAWSGVTCDNTTGHVIGLKLYCARLQGSFHSNNSLFFLLHLQTLRLSYNDFRGSTIPSKFGKFTQLEHLDFYLSNFSGHVPLEISYLSKLVSLGLICNNQELRVDTFTLKRIVTNLTNLERFYMNQVDMSSVSPVALMNLSSSLVNLTLWNCRLGGNLPVDYILQLPKLEILDLSWNENLTGSLLTKSNWSSTSPVLKYLGLSRTTLSIDLPYLIQNFKYSLKYLDLSDCKILGWNPILLANLTQISWLDLSSNNLGGEIPWSSLVHRKRLICLDLSDNNFIGQLPEISNLTEINYLDLSSNNLGGEIPWSSLIHLKSLQHLYLYRNSFIGQVPDEISFSSNYSSSNNILSTAGPFLLELEDIDLSDNFFNGTIPSWLYSLKSLEYLTVENNRFTGFNTDKFQSHSLKYIDLSNNKLHGSIPTSIFHIVNLTFLNLSSNALSGDFGLYDLSKLKSLFIFSISNNQLSGEIPPSICNLNSLKFLDLSNNSLNGTIHPCIGNFSVSLSLLNLRMNKLHGTIPLTFAKGNSLRYLNLNGNQLGGLFPQSLLTCKMLEVLDVGSNKINDTFPYWLGALPMLQVLILRSNRFHGSIDSPKTEIPFKNLRILDLSDNEFIGNLPTKYLENLMAMMDAHTDQLQYMGEEGYYQEESLSLVMKGFFIELVKIQTIFTTIDLSKNKFEGEIPRLIGKLNSLKGLNFSHNKLTGSIPPTLGNLSNLEWLDLSSNELVGEIPQQLTNMISLEVLNLSRNRLVGPIPNGKQFNTFENNSYGENLGLCGFPLSKMCGNNNEAQQSPSPNIQEEGGWKETYGFDWKIILMGYGCGIIIGVSMGYIVLSNEKVTLFLIRIGFTILLYA